MTMNMHAMPDETRNAAIKKQHATWSTFRVPTYLGIITLVGLVTALVGDDLWDWLSWAGLGIPVAVIVYYWLRQRGRRKAA
jgi:putative flippase GtrA